MALDSLYAAELSLINSLTHSVELPTWLCSFVVYLKNNHIHTANDLVILAVGKCCQSESETGFTVEKSLWLGFVRLFMYCFISSIGYIHFPLIILYPLPREKMLYQY